MATVQRPLMTINYVDYSKEPQQVSVYVPQTNDTSFTANDSAMSALKAAIDNLTLCEYQSFSKQSSRAVEDPPVYPSNVAAQRELKWRVECQDSTTGKTFTFTIPGPDLTDNLKTNSDEADLSSTDWAAFITAYEAIARSPDGNVCTVERAYIIGRNS